MVVSKNEEIASQFDKYVEDITKVLDIKRWHSLTL